VGEETWLTAGVGRSEAEVGEDNSMKLRLLEAALVEKMSPFCFTQGSGAAVGADATHCWEVVGVGEKLDAGVYTEVGGGLG
jgi:hypothetical protein